MIKQETTLTRNPGVEADSEEEEEGIISESWSACYSPSKNNLLILRIVIKKYTLREAIFS